MCIYMCVYIYMCIYIYGYINITYPNIQILYICVCVHHIIYIYLSYVHLSYIHLSYIHLSYIHIYIYITWNNTITSLWYPPWLNIAPAPPAAPPAPGAPGPRRFRPLPWRCRPPGEAWRSNATEEFFHVFFLLGTYMDISISMEYL